MFKGFCTENTGREYCDFAKREHHGSAGMRMFFLQVYFVVSRVFVRLV